MKQISVLLLSLLFALSTLGCECNAAEKQETEPAVTVLVVTEPAVTEPAVTEPPATEPPEEVPTQPTHSPLYLDSTPIEDVVCWFAEVCLDSEYVISGDPGRVQKWGSPIRYRIHGVATQEDLETLEDFCLWLNTVEGFPGIYCAEEEEVANLNIHFTDSQGLVDMMGPEYEGSDGGVIFWYDNHMIYDEIVCIRNDVDQQVRNSVILEELYNGLGPIQDTNLREDSLIWQGYSIPQELTPVDELILKLLYHPDLLCGMNVWECETVIRNLYY